MEHKFTFTQLQFLAKHVYIIYVITNLHVHNFTEYSLMSISNHKSKCIQLAPATCKQLDFLAEYATCTCTCLMKDAKEGRKKQARSNKQQGKATQHTQDVYTCQLIFLRKSDCLGCAVLLCLVVCLTLLELLLSSK